MKKYIFLSLLLALPQTSRPGFTLPTAATLLTAGAAYLANYRCHIDCGKAYGYRKERGSNFSGYINDSIQTSVTNYRQSVFQQISANWSANNHPKPSININSDDRRYIKIEPLYAKSSILYSLTQEFKDENEKRTSLQKESDRKITIFNTCCTAEYYLPIASTIMLGLTVIAQLALPTKMAKYKNYGYAITSGLAATSMASSLLKFWMFHQAQKVHE